MATTEVDAIEQKLCELLGETAPLAAPVTADTDLLDEVALESAQVMEFVMEVEDHFEVVIEQQALADVRTIGQLAAAVRAALK